MALFYPPAFMELAGRPPDKQQPSQQLSKDAMAGWYAVVRKRCRPPPVCCCNSCSPARAGEKQQQLDWPRAWAPSLLLAASKILVVKLLLVRLR